MSVIVCYCGENLNEIYSIFVFRISLGNLTNFSFIESSRPALSSSTKAPAKTHTPIVHLRRRMLFSTHSSFSSQHSRTSFFIIRQDRAHWADHFIPKKYGLILLHTGNLWRIFIGNRRDTKKWYKQIFLVCSTWIPYFKLS